MRAHMPCTRALVGMRCSVRETRRRWNSLEGVNCSWGAIGWHMSTRSRMQYARVRTAPHCMHEQARVRTRWEGRRSRRMRVPKRSGCRRARRSHNAWPTQRKQPATTPPKAFQSIALTKGTMRCRGMAYPAFHLMACIDQLWSRQSSPASRMPPEPSPVQSQSPTWATQTGSCYLLPAREHKGTRLPE